MLEDAVGLYDNGHRRTSTFGDLLFTTMGTAHTVLRQLKDLAR